MRTTNKSGEGSRPEFCEADRLFLPDEELNHILQRVGMPVMLYDEKGLRERAKSLSSVPQLHERDVTVSLCPFPEILHIAAEAGMNAVCGTPEELSLAVESGFSGERICYAGLCTRPELTTILRELGARLLIGSPILIPEQLPRRVALLVNIPARRTSRLYAAAPKPKAGLTAEEATVIASMIKRRGVADITLAVSSEKNCTSVGAISQKAEALISLAEQIREVSGTEIGGIHLGSGVGIGYNRFKLPIDAAAEWESLEKILRAAPRSYRVGCDITRNLIEPSAIFAAACLGVYERDKQTIQINAAFRQLAIPQLDRYRHISLLGKDGVRGRLVSDVIGSDLLEKDWFAESRLLPEAEAGDRLIMHDVGCCVGEMRECCLVCADGTVRRLRRRSDYFAASPDER